MAAVVRGREHRSRLQFTMPRGVVEHSIPYGGAERIARFNKIEEDAIRDSEKIGFIGREAWGPGGGRGGGGCAGQGCEAEVDVIDCAPTHSVSGVWQRRSVSGSGGGAGLLVMWPYLVSAAVVASIGVAHAQRSRQIVDAPHYVVLSAMTQGTTGVLCDI